MICERKDKVSFLAVARFTIITMIYFLYHNEGAIQRYKMGKIQLFHGTDHIIEKPGFSLGKRHNDYGREFYCTQELPLAMEWTCKQNTDGFVNEYYLEQDSLQILNLLDPQYNILHWLALLLKNRTFRLSNEISIDARNYIIENFFIDLTNYDIVIGYRADDSCFSFAEAFVQNGLSLRSLNQALRLGKLGKQTVLISKAREIYKKEIQGRRSYRNDIFILDILREEIKNDDARIQRILSD